MSRRGLALVGAGALLLTACGGGDDGGEGGTDGGGEASASDAGGEEASAERTEVGALTPRIVLAHEGGVTTLDSADGSVVGESDLEGFLRLSPAGDGRHVVVSSNDAFTMYDTGLEAVLHGDHYHYYAQGSSLTDLTVDAPQPGHVTPHGDRTALFSDGTGAITVFDAAALLEGEFDILEETSADAPHHGVAVPLEDGGLLVTQGDEDTRDTIQALDAEGNVTAETDQCPGVHGEAAAEPTDSGDVVAFGCEDGAVVYRDGDFHKIEADGEFEGTGTLKGHHDSPIILGNSNAEDSTSVVLIDTRDDSVTSVDLGSNYWFRSLDRGPDGEALVLTEDGELNIIDPESGDLLHEVPVTEPWTEPGEWQEAGPALSVADGTAFVIDPASSSLTMVDVASGESYRGLDLPVVPYDIQVTTGTASGEYDVSAGGHDHGEDGHDHGEEGHDHGDEEHDHDAEGDDHDHDHDAEGEEHDHDAEGHDH